MRIRQTFVALIVALGLTAGCAARGPIDAAPAALDQVDATALQLRAKAYLILDATSLLVERSAIAYVAADARFSFPDAVDTNIRDGYRRLTAAMRDGVAKLDAGASTWTEIKAVLDPILEGTQHLVTLSEEVEREASGDKSWLEKLRDVGALIAQTLLNLNPTGA